MRICSFEELTKKEVISCMDCTRLGFIVDINIKLEDAQICSVIVETVNKCFSLKSNRIEIPWECIKKIGDDLIIADYILPELSQNDNEKRGILTRLFKN